MGILPTASRQNDDPYLKRLHNKQRPVIVQKFSLRKIGNSLPNMVDELIRWQIDPIQNAFCEPVLAVFLARFVHGLGYSVGIDDHHLSLFEPDKVLVIMHVLKHSQRQVAVLDKAILSGRVDQDRWIVSGI